MKILYAPFTSRAEFLRRLAVHGEDRATLYVQTRARYDDGEQVILEIAYPGLPNRILTRAVAVSASKDAGFEEGDQAFDFADGESHKLDFLIAIATGKATAKCQRRHRRFPVRMPARLVCEDEELTLRGDAETEDMSASGVALRTPRTLPDGANVTIVLEPGDGSECLEFHGRVVWNRNDEINGVGVQFDRLGGDQMKRLRTMIRDVKRRGKTIEVADG